MTRAWLSSVPVPWCVALVALVVGSGCAVDAHRAALAAPPVTLETIARAEWVLRSWNLNDAAPAEPQVTLTVRDGKFVGTAGCNRYFAAVKLGELPGDVTIGPIGATRMACPQEQMTVESRFLKQLAAVKKFGFLAGQLALSYEADGVSGVMSFDAHDASGRK